LEKTLKTLDMDMYYQIRERDRLVRKMQREARRDIDIMKLWETLSLERASDAIVEESGSSMRVRLKEELFRAIGKRAAEVQRSESAALKRFDDETGVTFVEDGVYRMKLNSDGELVEVFHIKTGASLLR